MELPFADAAPDRVTLVGCFSGVPRVSFDLAPHPSTARGPVYPAAAAVTVGLTFGVSLAAIVETPFSGWPSLTAAHQGTRHALARGWQARYVHLVPVSDVRPLKVDAAVSLHNGWVSVATT